VTYDKEKRNAYQRQYREDGREPGRKGFMTKRPAELDRTMPPKELHTLDPHEYQRRYMRWRRSRETT
jgi:hypothetical protein